LLTETCRPGAEHVRDDFSPPAAGRMPSPLSPAAIEAVRRIGPNRRFAASRKESLWAGVCRAAANKRRTEDGRSMAAFDRNNNPAGAAQRFQLARAASSNGDSWRIQLV
jgi:hypothetical protein